MGPQILMCGQLCQVIACFNAGVPEIPLIYTHIVWTYLKFLTTNAGNCFARFDFSLIHISLFNNLTVDIGSQRTEAAAHAAVSMFNF